MLIGILYIAIPLFLTAIIAIKRQPNRFHFIITALTYACIIAYFWLTARWEVVGIYFRTALPLLFFGALLIGFIRIGKPRKNQKGFRLSLDTGIYLLLLVTFSVLNVWALKGYICPSNPIDLASPFRKNKQIVLSGGNSPLINGHGSIRPQKYAVDFAGLNKSGMRAVTVAGGPRLNDYEIYEESLYSPCEGIVAAVVDEYDDLIPPSRDLTHVAGNYILIECRGIEILLAHLKKGSIRVHTGDRVSTATLLAQVGNSGNSTEPHLHMHVEKGGRTHAILNSEGMPFTVNKQFLVRGDILRNEHGN